MRNPFIVGLLYGWIVVFALFILSSFILTFIINYSSITEGTLHYLSLAIGLAVLFIGAFVAGGKGKQTGWLIGLVIGLGFSLVTFLIQYLGYESAFTLQQFLYHGLYCLSAIIGSIIGVNIAGGKSA